MGSVRDIEDKQATSWETYARNHTRECTTLPLPALITRWETLKREVAFTCVCVCVCMFEGGDLMSELVDLIQQLPSNEWPP